VLRKTSSTGGPLLDPLSQEVNNKAKAEAIVHR